MRRVLLLLTLGGVAASAQTPIAAPAVTSVCVVGTTTCKAPPLVLPVRRGVTTGLLFKGRMLVGIAQRNIVVSTPSTVTATKIRGYPCGDLECLELAVAVAPTHDLAASRAVRFIFRTDSGAFGTANLLVLRLGRIESFSVSPAAPRWGAPVTVTVRGTDIGDAVVRVTNTAVTNVQSSDAQLTFTATTPPASIAPPQLLTPFTVNENAPASTAETAYHMTQPGGLAIAYACVAAPSPIFPADGATVTPQDGKVSLGWRTVLGGMRYAWELSPSLEISQASRDAAGGTLTQATSGTLTALAGGVSGTITLPSGTAGPINVSTAAAVAAGRTYRWRVRAADCGDAAPWSAYRTFKTP